MIHSEAERSVLEVITPKLERDGFEVLTDYSRTFVPKVSHGYLPDAIAVGRDRYIAIEIKASRNKSVEKYLKEIEKDFQNFPNWSFIVYYADELKKLESTNIVPLEQIMERIKNIIRLTAIDATNEALLVCWASLEALARHHSEKSFSRPQSPGRLVTVLAELGVLFPEEADLLRSLILKRNAFIHGQLDTKTTKEEVKRFVGILERVASFTAT